MTKTSQSPEQPADAGATPKARRSPWRRRALIAVAVVGILELVVGRYVARPLRIIHRAADPAMVYENTPGSFLGHATYDVWKAPLYMVLDLMRDDSSGAPTKAPPGYTLYRIDNDGCRAHSEGPIPAHADILFLGASQAFGMMVSEEDSVPGLLETSLRERGYAGLELSNCASIGHRLGPTLMTIERTQKAKQAKLVVTIVRPWHVTEQFDYTDVLQPPNDALRWGMDHSALVRLAYYIHRSKAHEMPVLSHAVLDAKLSEHARKMKAVGARSIFFLLDDHEPNCVVFDDLEPILREKGLGVVRLDTPSGPDDLFLDRDHHWSLKGSKLTTAQLLEPVIHELEALGVPRSGAAGTPAPPSPTPP